MKDTSYNSGFITYDDDATWLVTYADLMTLLLVFFVLLYTLSSFEKHQIQTVMESVKQQMEQKADPREILALMDLSEKVEQKMSIEEVTGLNSRKTSLFREINRFVRNVGRTGQLAADIIGGKIILRVSGEVLFASGSASLNPEAFPIFDKMVTIFADYPDFTINIKGHTDNVPIATPQFPSNWELSAIRATTVLKYLISKGIQAQRLTATGYGEILPLFPNTTDDHRAVNRRVEFVLEKAETGI
jgi:chemotaxis protein MotB